MPKRGLLHGEISNRIIGVFFQVYNELGPGFLEAVYANAMFVALTDAGLRVEREVPIAVYFRGRRVGIFRADAVVESVVLLEYKAGERLDPTCKPQVLNYLQGCYLELALLLHFGPKPAFKRLVMTNDRKLLPGSVTISNPP
jgi:GxxExxY protein